MQPLAKRHGFALISPAFRAIGGISESLKNGIPLIGKLHFERL